MFTAIVLGGVLLGTLGLGLALWRGGSANVPSLDQGAAEQEMDLDFSYEGDRETLELEGADAVVEEVAAQAQPSLWESLWNYVQGIWGWWSPPAAAAPAPAPAPDPGVVTESVESVASALGNPPLGGDALVSGDAQGGEDLVQVVEEMLSQTLAQGSAPEGLRTLGFDCIRDGPAL